MNNHVIDRINPRAALRPASKYLRTGVVSGMRVLGAMNLAIRPKPKSINPHCTRKIND